MSQQVQYPVRRLQLRACDCPGSPDQTTPNQPGAQADIPHTRVLESAPTLSACRMTSGLDASLRQCTEMNFSSSYVKVLSATLLPLLLHSVSPPAYTLMSDRLFSVSVLAPMASVPLSSSLYLSLHTFHSIDAPTVSINIRSLLYRRGVGHFSWCSLGNPRQCFSQFWCFHHFPPPQGGVEASHHA